MKIKKKKGFSMVELIIVIAVLAVLIAVLAPSLLTYTERSRAQKDESAMSEVVNAVQLAMADQNCYDEMIRYSCTNNYITYSDSSGNYGQQLVDEEFWAPDGSGRATTITFNPIEDENGKTYYSLDFALVNDMTYGNGSVARGRVMEGAMIENNQCYLKDATLKDNGVTAHLYSRIKQAIGGTIINTSSTYRNSSYTIFIKFNQKDGVTVADVDGSFNGTNLYKDAQASVGTGTSDYIHNKAPVVTENGGKTESVFTSSDLQGGGTVSYKDDASNIVFFGEKYAIADGGSKESLQFMADGSVNLYVNDVLDTSFPEGSAVYEGSTITFDGVNFVVASDRSYLMYNGASDCVFLRETNRSGIQRGVPYSGTYQGQSINIIFGDGDKVILSAGGSTQELPYGAVHGTNQVSILGLLVGNVRASGTEVDCGPAGVFKIKSPPPIKLEQPYVGTLSGSEYTIVFHADNTASFNDNSAYWTIDDGQYSQDKNTMFLFYFLTYWNLYVSDDGNTLIFGDSVLHLQTTDCPHSSTYVTNSSSIYTGDIKCRNCDALVDVGTYSSPNNTYIVGSSSGIARYYTGYTKVSNTLPAEPNIGDVYIFGGVEYRYGYSYDTCDGHGWSGNGGRGWGYVILDGSNSPRLLGSICGKPVVHSSNNWSNANITSKLIYEEGWETVAISYYTLKGATSVGLPKSMTKLNFDYIYGGQMYSGTLKDIYYAGSEEEWNSITMNVTKEQIANITVHFNSTN